MIFLLFIPHYSHLIKETLLDLIERAFFWIIFISDFVISYTEKNVGIPMGTNCAPLVADLFLFC